MSISRVKNNWLLLLSITAIVWGCSHKAPTQISDAGTLPDIFPADFGATIPYNIAPMNFRANKPCDRLFLSIKGKNGTLDLSFKANKTAIPVSKWSQFLFENKGDSIALTLSVQSEGHWMRYNPFSYFIAPDPIDSYLVYRLIMPGYQTWNTMGIYQRNLSSFAVDKIVDSRLMPHTCMNCHSLANNNPDNMLIHFRENNSGTILIRGEKIEKLNTKTPATFSSVAFPSWHPSTKFIAFSIDKVRQLFPSVGQERAHAFDMESDMVIYDVDENEFITSPLIFSKEAYEAFPSFSPDGNALCFVTAPATPMPDSLRKIRYSLCAISFDAKTKSLGTKVDTLILASRLGKSVTMPRFSPDGKHIMVAVSDHGNFPAYDKDADLYMYNLSDSSLKRMDALDSDDVETYHSWSSNGRWVVFSSRRMDGLYMNAYFAYIDKNGVPRKPFLLPQEDADFHNSFLYSFNAPEFSVKKVSVDPYRIEKTAKTMKSEQVKFGQQQNGHY